MFGSQSGAFVRNLAKNVNHLECHKTPTELASFPAERNRAGNKSKQELNALGSDIRRSENALLDVWSQPGFFLAGGAAVIALLFIFVVLEATG